MSTRGTTYYGQPEPMDWVPEPRECPFDELPARFCGCPEGEQIMDEDTRIVRGQE